MTTNELRAYFKENNLSYSDIDEKKINRLEFGLKTELDWFKNGSFTMKLNNKSKKNFNDRGELEYCFFEVTGYIDDGVTPKFKQFKNREAISFNRKNKDGDFFIGFAEWSSSKNLIPFYRAFKNWVDEITKECIT